MSFKAGDKVKCYDHAYNWGEDGWEGFYVKPSKDIPGAHMVDIPGEGTLTYRRLVPVDTRSEVQVYKEDILFPALERKKKQHNWCEEYDEFLKEIGVERPLPKLPTGKNALVECKSGLGGSSKATLVFDGIDWWAVGLNFRWSYSDVQKEYIRTVFEGE